MLCHSSATNETTTLGTSKAFFGTPCLVASGSAPSDHLASRGIKSLASTLLAWTAISLDPVEWAYLAPQRLSKSSSSLLLLYTVH